MKPYLEEGIKCQCCSNTDTSKFKEKFIKGDITILECMNCSFIFIPSYYRKNIQYHLYKDEDTLKQVQSGNDWLKVQRHLLRIKLIKRYIKSGSLFDLGAGWGHFLVAAKQEGYQIYGVEVSKYQYIYAKENLNLPVDHIDFFKMEKRQFDIITMWDVLEHIDEVDLFVGKCSEMINKNGYLILQVPQIDSFIAKMKKENWNMMGLDHVNYFSKKTITLVLEKHGFEVQRIKSSMELKLFLMYTILPWIKKLKGSNKEDGSISSAERQEYFNKTTSKPKWVLKIMLFMHNILYNLLSFLGIGEEMIVVAKKK